MNPQIQVGFCRKDITPEGAVPLGGYGNDSSRISTGVRDPITGTCLAVTDENGTTALLFSCDLLHGNTQMTQELRVSASKATGVPEEQIHLASTHNHSAPGISSPTIPAIERYYRFFNVMMTEAAVGAMADRAPATLKIGSTQTDTMNFVRHYRLENGTYAGDNFGRWNSPIAAHASEPDNQMQLVRFCREGKRDILLVNWQAHALLSSTGSDEARAKKFLLSADYPGAFRKQLEEDTGLSVIFFLGAAGNLNPYSRIPGETPAFDAHEFGQKLAKVAGAALDGLTPARAGSVSFRKREILLPIDHSDDHLVPLATEIWALWSQDQALCLKTAREHGFHSAFACRDIISRSRQPAQTETTLHTLVFGDIAFVCAPYEMFCDNGKYIKEQAPYPMTVVSTCTNGALSYLASDFAFTHGSYEVDSRKFPRGTAERLANHFVEMLKEQKEEV